MKTYWVPPAVKEEGTPNTNQTPSKELKKLRIEPEFEKTSGKPSGQVVGRIQNDSSTPSHRVSVSLPPRSAGIGGAAAPGLGTGESSGCCPRQVTTS